MREKHVLCCYEVCQPDVGAIEFVAFVKEVLQVPLVLLRCRKRHLLLEEIRKEHSPAILAKLYLASWLILVVGYKAEVGSVNVQTEPGTLRPEIHTADYPMRRVEMHAQL
jgi:hypothetical protein